MRCNHLMADPGLALGLLSALALLFAAGSRLFAGQATSVAFGVPLAGTALAYARVKGMPDLIVALLILAFLLRGKRRAQP